MAKAVLDYGRPQPKPKRRVFRYVVAAVGATVAFVIVFLMGGSIVQQLAPNEVNPGFALLLAADVAIAGFMAVMVFLAVMEEPKSLDEPHDPAP